MNPCKCFLPALWCSLCYNCWDLSLWSVFLLAVAYLKLSTVWQLHLLHFCFTLPIWGLLKKGKVDVFQISDCWISWNDVQILLFSYLLYRKFQYMSVIFLMVWFVLKNIKITIKKHHPRALLVLFFLCWDFVLNKINLLKYLFHLEGLGKWAPILWEHLSLLCTAVSGAPWDSVNLSFRLSWQALVLMFMCSGSW